MPAALTENVSGYEALDDGALAARSRDGDEGAVRALVRRHNQRLFRVVRGVVQDDSTAEDVVQETYVRAFTGLHGFRGDSAFATWLTRIALNAAYARLRRTRPEVSSAALERMQDEGQVIMFPMSTPPESPEGAAARRQVRDLLERAVGDLPETFRVVFLMREVEGLGTRETAELLAIHPITVKTRLYRARRLIRRDLGRTLDSGFGDLFPFAGARCAHTAEAVVARLRAAGWPG